MRQRRFDERLEGIIHEARVRFMDRLREAYFHGHVMELLVRYDFDAQISEDLVAGQLISLEKAAADLLEQRIRRARRGGYLFSCLEGLRMEDLLSRQDRALKRPPHFQIVRQENQAAAEGSLSSNVCSSRASLRRVK